MSLLRQNNNSFTTDENNWDDLRIVPGAFSFPGVSDPSLVTWQPGGAGAIFRVYGFSVSDEGFFTVQMPHGYKKGTDLKPHIHWTPRNNGITENGNTVAWKIDYSIANVTGVFSPSATIDLTDTCSGVNEQHEITSSGTISGTGLDISHIIIGRVYRDTGDTWTGSAAATLPVLLEVDFHFKQDGAGSDNETSKSF